MELVDKIKMDRIAVEEYSVTFDIPDNCDFILHDDTKGGYTVEVNLIPPATSPSSTFNTHIFDTRAFDGKIVISFDQQDYQTNLTTRRIKPVIRIDTIGH